MKNKLILSIAFASLFLSAGVSFAATTTTAQPPANSTSTATSTTTIVATVNIQNARIVSQNGNQLNVSFDLTNRVGAQPQIKYGIMAIQQVNSSTQILVDEKVYDDVVSLSANDSKSITVTYVAPSYLKGSYMIVVEAENEDAFPFGTTLAGTAVFDGAGQYLDVNSCYLTVSDDASSTPYALLQGVDVNPSEKLIAHCRIQSSLHAAAIVTPSFTTYYRDTFGNIVGTSTASAMTFAAGKTVPVLFTIPYVTTTPQAYDAVLTLQNASGNVLSNSVTFHYVIHGESATIQNVVFDKDAYQKGDTANISFLWTGSADSFPGSRLGLTSTTATLALQINDGSGNPCAAPYSLQLNEQNSLEHIAVPVTSDCQNPTASVVIENASGTPLAQNDFAVATKPAQSAAASSDNGGMSWLAVVFVVLVVLLAAFALFMLWKRKKGGMAIMIVLLAAGGLLITGHQAKADTFVIGTTIHYDGSWGTDPNTGAFFTVNMSNGTTFNPGNPIVLSGSAKYGWCANLLAYVTFGVGTGGPTFTALNEGMGTNTEIKQYFTAGMARGTTGGETVVYADQGSGAVADTDYYNNITLTAPEIIGNYTVDAAATVYSNIMPDGSIIINNVPHDYVIPVRYFGNSNSLIQFSGDFTTTAHNYFSYENGGQNAYTYGAGFYEDPNAYIYKLPASFNTIVRYSNTYSTYSDREWSRHTVTYTRTYSVSNVYYDPLSSMIFYQDSSGTVRGFAVDSSSIKNTKMGFCGDGFSLTDTISTSASCGYIDFSSPEYYNEPPYDSPLGVSYQQSGLGGRAEEYSGGVSIPYSVVPAAQGSASSPTQSTPTQSTPTQSTPTQSTPTQSTPTQSTPTQSTPTQSTPTQSTPTQSTPTQSTPTQSTPTQSTPTQSTVCSISSVTNGTVDQSTCVIHCDYGYAPSGSSCTAIPPVINTFLANNTTSPTIVLPQYATLQWSTSNATACALNGSSSGINIDESSLVVHPSVTTIYTLSCSGPGGSTTGSQTVTVANPTTQEVAP